MKLKEAGEDKPHKGLSLATHDRQLQVYPSGPGGPTALPNPFILPLSKPANYFFLSLQLSNTSSQSSFSVPVVSHYTKTMKECPLDPYYHRPCLPCPFQKQSPTYLCRRSHILTTGRLHPSHLLPLSHQVSRVQMCTPELWIFHCGCPQDSTTHIGGGYFYHPVIQSRAAKLSAMFTQPARKSRLLCPQSYPEPDHFLPLLWPPRKHRNPSWKMLVTQLPISPHLGKLFPRLPYKIEIRSDPWSTQTPLTMMLSSLLH